MPLQSSGIIVVDKTSVISSNLNNSHQQQQQLLQHQLHINTNLNKNPNLSSSSSTVVQQRQQLQNSTATIVLPKHQLGTIKQNLASQKGRHLNTGDEKTISGVQQAINNSSTTTVTTTKNLMRRNQRTISTSSSSNSSMNPGASQSISSLSSPSHQQTSSTTKHIQFQTINQQQNYNTNQMNQQQSQQTTTQHHIIQTTGGHPQVIVSEEYLEHATATGAAQIVNISANDLINSQIIKLVADGNGQNVLIDSLGNVTTTNSNNGSGSGGGSTGGNTNSKLLVGNLVLSSTSATSNVNTNKGQQLTAAGQPQQQINFVSAKQIPYLTTSSTGNVTTKNQTIQKIVNFPLKTNNTIKNAQHQQQTFQVSANNQIIHQSQNSTSGSSNATGQIIQKVNMPRNVHVVARVQTVSQQSQQQSQQQGQQQSQNQLIMQQKFVHGVTTTQNKTNNLNMIKKQTVNQMKVQHHKISNVNIAGQQQQVKTFIHQQQSQPTNQQFSTVINSNIQPATLTTTTKQLKTQQKVIKQFNNNLGNSTTVTLMQQSQQQQNQQINTSGTYTINNKISGLPIQQHQRIINTASGKNSAINQNATTTKYVMQNHIVIPSNGSASGQQTTNNSTTNSNHQQKNSNLNNSIPNSIVVNQQIINTVNNSHNTNNNLQHQQQLQPQSGTIKFVNAHGTVLQTHQQSSSAGTVVGANNQQQTRLRGYNQHQQQQNNQPQFLDNNGGKLNAVNDNHVLYQIQQPTTTFMMNQQSTNSTVVLQGHQQQQRSQANNTLSDNIVIVNGTKMTDEDSARILQSMALKSYGNQRFQQQQQQQQPHQQTKVVQNSQIIQQHSVNSQSTQSQPNFVISRDFQFSSNQSQQTTQHQQQFQGYQVQSTSRQTCNQSNNSAMRSQSISERKRDRESKAAAAAAVAAAANVAAAVTSFSTVTVNVSQPTMTHSTNSSNTSEFFRVNSNEIHKNYYSQPICPTIIDNIPLPRGDNTPAAQQAEHDDDIIGEEVRPVPISTHDSRLQALHAFLQDHTYVVPMPSLLSTDIITTNAISSPLTTTSISGSNSGTLTSTTINSGQHNVGNSTTVIGVNALSNNGMQQQQQQPNISNCTNLQTSIIATQYQPHSTQYSSQQHQQPQQHQQGQTINANESAVINNNKDKVFIAGGNLHGQNVGILSNSSSITNTNNNTNNLIGNIVQLKNNNSGKNISSNLTNIAGPLISSTYPSQVGQHSQQPDDDANSVISNESNNCGHGRLEMDLGEETETAPEAEAEDDSVTRCICDLTHDDGYMICCDKCFTWQHVDCMGIDRTNIPDEYLCEICQPRQVDKARARSLQLIKRKEQQAAILSNMQFNSVNGTANININTGNSLQEGQNLPPSTPVEILKPGKKGKPKKSELLKKTSVKKERIQKRKETKRVNKRKTKGYDFKSVEKNADNLRQWIENYEVAVTNHYSPELRARLQAIGKQPSLLQAINAHENKWLRNYYGKFDMDSKGTVIPHAGGKILISNMDILPNSPIIELRGKYMLTTQFKTQNPSFNMNSPPPPLITASKNNRTPGPFIFFYQLPVDSASLAAASGANASRGIAALAAAAAVTSANGLSTEICVDTRTYGNEARFVRRSCRPNAELQYSFEKGAIHLFIVSLSNIMSSTEITIRHEPHDLLALDTKNSNQNLYIAPTSTICACGLTKDCTFGQLPQLPATISEASSTITKKKSKKNLLNGTLSSKTRAGVKKNKKIQSVAAGQRGRSTSSSGESQNEMSSPNLTSTNTKTAVITTNSSNSESFSPIGSNNYNGQSAEEPLKYIQESLGYSAPINVSSAQIISSAPTIVQSSQIIQQALISPTASLSTFSTQQVPSQLQAIPTIIQPILQQQTQQNLSPLTLTSSQQNSQMIISQIQQQQQQQDKNMQPISITQQPQVQHIVQILPSPGLNSPITIQQQQQAVMQLITHPQIELQDTRQGVVESTQQFVKEDSQISGGIIKTVSGHNDVSSQQIIVDEKIQSLQSEKPQIIELQLQYSQKPSNGQIISNQIMESQLIKDKKLTSETEGKIVQHQSTILMSESVNNSVISTPKNIISKVNLSKENTNKKSNSNISTIGKQNNLDQNLNENLSLSNSNVQNISSNKFSNNISSNNNIINNKNNNNNSIQNINITTNVNNNNNSNNNNNNNNSNNNNHNNDNNSNEISSNNSNENNLNNISTDQIDAFSANKTSIATDFTPTKTSPQKTNIRKSSKSRTTSTSEDNSTPNMSIDQAHTNSPSETNKRESRKLTREERKMEAIVKAIEKMEKNQQRKNELKQSKTSKRRSSNSPSSPKRTKTCSQSEDGADDEKSMSNLKSSSKKVSIRKKKRKGNRSYAMHTATQRKRRKSRLNSNESDGGTSDDSPSIKSPSIMQRQSSHLSESNNSEMGSNIFSVPAQYQQHVSQNNQQNQMTLMTDLIQSQAQMPHNHSSDNSSPVTNQEAGLLLAFANIDKAIDEQHGKSSPKRQARSSIDLKSPQTPTPAISSACLLIESALGPLEGLSNDEIGDSFKVPSKAAKTKKSLMSDWLNQSNEEQEEQVSENKLLNDSNVRNCQMESNNSIMHFPQNSPKGFETLVQAAMVDYKPPSAVNSLSFIPPSANLLQQQQLQITNQSILSASNNIKCEEIPENLCLAAKKVEEFIIQNDYSSAHGIDYMTNNSNIQLVRDTDSPSSIAGIVSENPTMTCSNSAAKKRWLRQAISEETDEHQNLMTSASNSPTSQQVPNGFTTPLKKRRLVVVKNEVQTYTDDCIGNTAEEISLNKNGSDSSLSNDEYKAIKLESEQRDIKDEIHAAIKEDGDVEMEIKNEIKTSDSNSADNDVDVLGFCSPNRKIDLEENYNLIKIEPEDPNGDIKVDIEKEETVQSPFENCDNKSMKIESKIEPNASFCKSDEYENEHKCDIKSNIPKEENFKHGNTFENILDDNQLIKTSKEGNQINDSQKLINKKQSKNPSKSNNKPSKKPNTPISPKNEICLPELKKDRNHNLASTHIAMNNLDESIHSDELADIQKTLHSFHTENIMLLQSRNKKTKKTDIAGPTKEKHSSKKEKLCSSSKSDTKLSKKEKDKISKKDKSSKKRDKDEIHKHKNENVTNKEKLEFEKKNNFEHKHSPKDDIHNNTTTFKGCGENHLYKVSMSSNPQYILTTQELSSPPQHLQNSIIKVNNQNFSQQPQSKNSETVQSSYLTTSQNIPLSTVVNVTSAAEYTSQSCLNQYNFSSNNNCGLQQANALVSTSLSNQQTCNSVLNTTSQSTGINMPYYNTIYGKLLDPSKTITQNSNMNLASSSGCLYTQQSIAPNTPTTPIQTSNLLMSDYKSYSTLGAYVTSSASFLTGSSGISSTVLNIVGGTQNTSNNTSNVKCSSGTSSLLDMGGVSKIITKTASHDPRLNPQLSIPEPAPVPKRKLSINEYRKRKQQSNESTANSLENSDSNSSNNTVGGKKVESFDDQISDPTKVQFSPAPTLLEKQQEILCERLKTLKQQKNLAGTTTAATNISSTSTSINNNNNNIVVIGGDGEKMNDAFSSANNCIDILNSTATMTTATSTTTTTTNTTLSSNFATNSLSNIISLDVNTRNSTLSSLPSDMTSSTLVTNKILNKELSKSSKLDDALRFSGYNNNNDCLSPSSSSQPSSTTSTPSPPSPVAMNILDIQNDNNNSKVTSILSATVGELQKNNLLQESYKISNESKEENKNSNNNNSSNIQHIISNEVESAKDIKNNEDLNNVLESNNNEKLLTTSVTIITASTNENKLNEIHEEVTKRND